MKTYKNLFPQTQQVEIIDEAFRVAIKRKTRRKNVKYLIDNYEKAKAALQRLIDGILNDTVKPYIHHAIEINDGFKLKKRTILQPYFSEKNPEQWLQHLIIQILKPIFSKGMYEFSCGSVPGRGVHYGKKYLEKYIKNNPKKLKYALKSDIYHFYETVDTELIKERLRKIIKDEKFLKLVFFVLDSNTGIKKDGTVFRPGLPIGFYTSQWFANWFLQPFDHYVKEELKATFYMRYMDDIVIYGSNKRELHKIFKGIEKYFSGVGLGVKGNWQIFPFDYNKDEKRCGRFIDFMGFKFYRDKITIRKTIFLRSCRLARRLKKKVKITWYDSTRILSYIGWYRHTDTDNAYKKYIGPNINVSVCKKLVSKHDRRINHAKN